MPTSDSTRKIIITGDDFGLNPRVNAEIERYHRAGALHQASLIVTAPHVEEAVAIAARNPTLRVGLHLTLCGSAPVAHAAPRVNPEPSLVPHAAPSVNPEPSLVAHAAPSVNLKPTDLHPPAFPLSTQPSAITDPAGHFANSPAIAGLRYFFCPWLRPALRAEIQRQFDRFRALGFPPTYWDGHVHLHLHPVIFRLTLPIAIAHRFTHTRLVREPGPPALLPWIFTRLSRAAILRVCAAGIAYPDRTFGLRDTGRMDTAAFARAFTHATTGTTEIYFHPGADEDPPQPETIAALLAGHVSPLAAKTERITL